MYIYQLHRLKMIVFILIFVYLVLRGQHFKLKLEKNLRLNLFTKNSYAIKELVCQSSCTFQVTAVILPAASQNEL